MLAAQGFHILYCPICRWSFLMFIDGLLDSQVARTVVGVSFDVADAGRADSVEELEVLVARFEARVAEARETFAGAVDLAERVRDGCELVPATERQAVVGMLLRAEMTLAEMGRLVAPRALANESRAAAVAPRLLPLLRQMTGLIEVALRLHAEAAREVRWALLELEAAAEPAADGPVLAGPAELGSFFQGLRAAS
jgi:hypothetical protein